MSKYNVGDTVYYVDFEHDRDRDLQISVRIEQLIVSELDFHNKCYLYNVFMEHTENLPDWALRFVHDDYLFPSIKDAIEYSIYKLNGTKYDSN